MTTRADLLFDMENILADPLFGESVTYTPSGGAPVSISARVYRSGLRQRQQRGGQGGSTLEYDIEILVSTADVPVVVENADTATLGVEVGGTPVVMSVAKIMAQDPGAWKLGLVR